MKSSEIALMLVGMLIALSAIILLTGCNAYDREYSATYDLDNRAAIAGVRITPGTGRRALSANVRGEIDWTRANNDLPKMYRDK